MPRVVRQGVPLNNLPSVDTCRERGWGRGVFLIAPNWKNPREIVEIYRVSVVLRDAMTRSRVKSFHPDIRVADSQEVARWQIERKRMIKIRDKNSRRKNAAPKKVLVVCIVENATGVCIREVECGASRSKASKVELGLLGEIDLDRFSTRIDTREAVT